MLPCTSGEHAFMRYLSDWLVNYTVVPGIFPEPLQITKTYLPKTNFLLYSSQFSKLLLSKKFPFKNSKRVHLRQNILLAIVQW